MGAAEAVAEATAAAMIAVMLVEEDGWGDWDDGFGGRREGRSWRNSGGLKLDTGHWRCNNWLKCQYERSNRSTAESCQVLHSIWSSEISRSRNVKARQGINAYKPQAQKRPADEVQHLT